MTPRISCTDTVSHAYGTFHKEEGGKRVRAPINRFYGSQVYAPQGPAMSTPGYSSAEEDDALCGSGSSGSHVGPGGACPDVCAYMPCNTGRRYTGVLFKCQRVLVISTPLVVGVLITNIVSTSLPGVLITNIVSTSRLVDTIQCVR